jgi:hypothetical protein
LFLLRHANYFELSLESDRIQRISRHTVPDFSKLRVPDAVRLAKKRPHPLTRKGIVKRVTYLAILRGKWLV